MNYTIHKHSNNTIYDCLHKLPKSFFNGNALASLEEHLLSWKKLWVAFSWGPDSVFLLLHILYLSINKKFNTNTIIILHYMHHVRNDDDKDWIFMKENIFESFSYGIASYIWNDNRESKLREVRWNWINEMSLLYRLDTIVTWHNMTDRVETSLLNAVRGSSRRWWNWMSKINKKFFWEVSRPLLHISKKGIIEKLETYCCPYLLDPTNNNESVSERNRLRRILFSKIEWIWIYSKDRRNTFYECIEKWDITKPIWYKICTTLPHRGNWILLRLNINKSTTFEEVKLVVNSDLVVDNSTTVQRDYFVCWLWLWYFKIWKHWILRTSWMFYYTTLWKDFWFIDSNLRSIKAFWLDMSIWRLPKKSDYFKWKVFCDRLQSNRVPVFWRNCLPVKWETSIIDEIYSLEEILW